VSVRILIADDHPLVRSGLRRVIEQEPGFSVVAEAADGAEAVELALAEEVDLAILDVAMPRLTGLQAAEELSQRRPETAILMLSMYDNQQYMLAAARAGASGYLLKSVADEQVVVACQAALRGERLLVPTSADSRVSDQLAGDSSGIVDQYELLTRREREVLKLVAEGQSSKEIAATLVVSLKTIDRHRANIIKKLGIRDRVGLTRYAIRHGLTEP
jgi:DNA-binding NarL/FixJ family response regulator